MNMQLADFFFILQKGGLRADLVLAFMDLFEEHKNHT
jgi:hypothetical protein